MKTKNIFLFIALLACPIFAQAQFHIEKKVTYDPNTPDHYTASLEAFMTDASTPVDIVLVVDVSKFNISENIAALKTGANSFVTQIKSAFPERTDVKIAIVPYRDDVLKVTELKSISDYSISGGKYSEVDAIPNASGNYNLPAKGLNKAKGLLNANDNHKKFVVFCAANLPNDSNTAVSSSMTKTNYSKMMTALSNGLSEAWDLKNSYDATLYTILYSAAKQKQNNKYYLFICSKYGEYLYMDLSPFEHFSSNYVDTQYCDIPSSVPSSNSKITPTFRKEDGTEDKTSSEGQYYYVGLTSEELSEAFSSIKTDIVSKASSSSSFGTISVKDVIGDHLKYAGSDNSQINLYKSKCTKLEGGDYYFDDANKETVSATKSFSDNTVTVSGYDFVANKVSGTASSGSGYKLIVQYPMIIKSGVTMPGTLYTGASGSGIINDGTIMKALTPASVNVYKIQVTISGLHNGESATFNVYKLDGSNKTLKTRLIATQKDDTGSASTSYIVPEAGNYEVEETSWNWPYTLTTPTSGRSITKSVSGTSVVNFEFRNGPSRTSPNHTESSTVITTLN